MLYFWGHWQYLYHMGWQRASLPAGGSQQTYQKVIIMAKASKALTTPTTTLPAPPTEIVVAIPAPTKVAVLQPLPAANVRSGTARSAAYSMLAALVGSDRNTVLEGLRVAETVWHKEQGRVVKGINPGGWLRVFGATFAAPTTEQPEQDATPQA